MGAYYLQPPDARAIFLHNDLLCNDTCSVNGGSITYWGGTNGKGPGNLRISRITNFKNRSFISGQGVVQIDPNLVWSIPRVGRP